MFIIYLWIFLIVYFCFIMVHVVRTPTDKLIEQNWPEETIKRIKNRFHAKIR